MNGKPDNQTDNVGVFIVGALGDISTTLIVGSLAIRSGLSSQNGLVTTALPFNQLDFTPIDKFVFGGLDIKHQSLSDSAEDIYNRSKTFTREILNSISTDLHATNDNIVINEQLNWNVTNVTPSVSSSSLVNMVSSIRDYIKTFKINNNLKRVIVVELSSAEAMPSEGFSLDLPVYQQLDTFECMINDNKKEHFTPSMIYTYAAFKENCPYINFTPNLGTSVHALQKLAILNAIPFSGNDGKTGETLVKTALAPMFSFRNLRVLSWEGVNLLGNNDGKTLHDPSNKVSKIQNKENVLQNILGYPVHSGVNINYVPSLGDWKTAWDFIHFQGFLDVNMSMQFTWQGCDSILAAPLILDLVRFTDFASRKHEVGMIKHLAAFYKNPIDVEEMALHTQFEMLLHYVARHTSELTSKEPL